MTEPRILELLAFVEAERDDLARLSAEAAECAALALDRGWGVLERRLCQLATDLACKIPVLDRLAPRGDDAEQTQPILISREHEICDRCHGTGEVPIVEVPTC